MSELPQVGVLAALWLGVITSISPCPLATNIAAMSYLSRQVGHRRRVLLDCAGYALGRVAAYVLVGFLVVKGLLSIPGMAQFLQKSSDYLLGPILIVVGLFLLGVFKIGFSGLAATGEKAQEWARRAGAAGPALLGFVFALSFCPVSAGLFFGSLIPLSLESGSAVLYPSLYGIGTGLPVVVFAVIIAMGAGALGSAFNRVRQFESWARIATGVIFIAVGVFQTLRWTFGLI